MYIHRCVCKKEPGTAGIRACLQSKEIGLFASLVERLSRVCWTRDGPDPAWWMLYSACLDIALLI